MRVCMHARMSGCVRERERESYIEGERRYGSLVYLMMEKKDKEDYCVA
jgi:hypothetical protein